MKFEYFFLICMLLFAIFSFILLHEITHQEVYKIYNVKSYITVDLEGFKTCPDLSDINKLSNDERLSLLQAQAFVETIGYQLTLPYLMIVLITLKKYLIER